MTFARIVSITAFAILTTSLALPLAAHAVPVITQASQFSDRFAPHSVPGLPVGDKIQIAATIDGASTLEDTTLTVLATQGSTTIPLTFFPFTAPIIVDPLYLAFIDFTGAPSDPWTITAEDSTGTSLPALTPAIVTPQFVPFVSNITVSDSSATPTISWTLPDLTGLDLEQSRVRAIEADTGIQVFQSLTSGLNATSFTIPAGFLQEGKTYVYRVSLEDVEAQSENRSNAFSSVVTVPEPGTLALLAVGLVGLAVTRRRA